MSKHSLSGLAAVAVLCAVGLGSARAEPVVSLTESVSTIGTGEDVTVDVNVSDVADLFGFQFDLGFDPSVLNALSSSEGSFLPGGGATFFLNGTNDNVFGSVASTADTLTGPVPGVTGSGTLASFTFAGIAPGTSAFSLGNVFLLDSNLNLLDNTVAGVSVTVKTPSTSVPEPESLGLIAFGMAGAWFARRRRTA